jgi:hypothetical protein
MWAYLGSTCPDSPSPGELSTTEVETWIHKVLDSAVVPPPGAGPNPLQRGIASVRVIPQVLFQLLLQFFLFTLHVILCRVSGISMLTSGALISPWRPQGRQ